MMQKKKSHLKMFFWMFFEMRHFFTLLCYQLLDCKKGILSVGSIYSKLYLCKFTRESTGPGVHEKMSSPRGKSTDWTEFNVILLTTQSFELSDILIYSKLSAKCIISFCIPSRTAKTLCCTRGTYQVMLFSSAYCRFVTHSSVKFFFEAIRLHTERCQMYTVFCTVSEQLYIYIYI